MTPDEARTKWCPMARVGNETELSEGSNRWLDMGHSHCIADDCMMWRWKMTPASKQPDNSAVWMENDKHGYCGLAGRE